ncbi:MAG: hypothetical protein RR569_08935 [Acinetobacter sp.]
MIALTGTAATNQRKGSTQKITVTRKNRIIVYGGAYSKSDNNTFLDASNNLQRMYKAKESDKYNVYIREIKVKQDLIDLINRQPVNSIRSLDIFTHGGEDSLYMVSVREGDGSSNFNKNWLWRYIVNNETFKTHHLKSLKTNVFLINSKIEIHGCKTAENPRKGNNIVSVWSKILYDAGKTRSVVIGHTTNTSPLIHGSSTKLNEQSYMWLERAIYRNGKLQQLTKIKGFLDEEALTK